MNQQLLTAVAYLVAHGHGLAVQAILKKGANSVGIQVERRNVLGANDPNDWFLGDRIARIADLHPDAAEGKQGWKAHPGGVSAWYAARDLLQRGGEISLDELRGIGEFPAEELTPQRHSTVVKC